MIVLVLNKKIKTKKEKNQIIRKGKIHSNRDVARYKIILWIHSRGEVIQNSMVKDTQSGLPSMKWGDLSTRLNELEEWGIIQKKQSEVVSLFVYSLTDKGREIVESLVNLKEKYPGLNFGIYQKHQNL